MARPDSPALGLRRWLLWTAAGAGLLAVCVGLWRWLHPPAPALAVAHGRAGERYAPYLIGIDAGGGLSVDGERFAPPRDGRVDREALYDLARPHRLRRKQDADPSAEPPDWQLLDVDLDVPMYAVASVAEALASHGVPRVAFAATDLPGTAASSLPGLVHIRPRSGLGLSCGAALGVDPSLLAIRVEAEWEALPYVFGAVDGVKGTGGDLAGLRARLDRPEVAHVLVVARPEAAWGDVLAVLAELDARGLPVELPEVVAEDV